jgi:hypothetical protein
LSVKERVELLIKQVKSGYFTYYDINENKLLTAKYIGKTKKEWECFSCNDIINIGSQCMRSSCEYAPSNFENVYRCEKCIELLNSDLEDDINESILNAAYIQSEGHGQF